MSQFVKCKSPKNCLIKKGIHSLGLYQSYFAIQFKLWLQLPIDPCQNLDSSPQCQHFFRLTQSCGSGFIESGYGSGSSISSDPIRIQGFDDQKLKKKNTAEHFLSLFLSKITVYFCLGYRKSL